MINYIIESSICLGSFYAFYWLFLSREKLLSINRFYLLTTAILSLLIPLLNFDFQIGLFRPLALLSSETLVTQSSELQSTDSWSLLSFFTPIYFIGLLAAVGLLFAKLILLRKRLGKELSFKNKQVEIAETDGLNAYSFFNTIFIGKELNSNSNLKEHIIAHELAHIEGRHSLDLLFFELLQCIYWFNPFSYFYTKSIKLQHEYIADNRALEITNPKHYERSLLELTLSKVNGNLISNFSEHPIQKRLKMIQKINSNVMKKLKPLFVLPVLGILIIGFACSQEPDADIAAITDPYTEIEVPLNVVTEGNFEFKVKEIREEPIGEMLELVKVEGRLRENNEFTLKDSDVQEYEVVLEEVGVAVENRKNKLMKLPFMVKEKAKSAETPVVTGVRTVKATAAGTLKKKN